MVMKYSAALKHQEIASCESSSAQSPLYWNQTAGMASSSAMMNDCVVRPTAATVAMSRKMLNALSTSRPWSFPGMNDTAPISAISTANNQKQR